MAGLLALGIASPDAAIEESQMKVTAATSLAIIALAMSPAIATAKSIKNQVPEAALAAYCATVPVDSETSATITLDDGTVLNGSIHCEAEDLIIVDTDDALLIARRDRVSSDIKKLIEKLKSEDKAAFL